ncbi:hypothetical protein [Paenarthrobacter nicotinovorans]|uniref:hypothetical protein n=1 Tax=Paenarthrobacter nicotinovorans TaxID=29320 RepID=UPI003D667195
MNPSQFRDFIRSHHAILVEELRLKGVSYDQLGPALVPTSGKRVELALLFNVDLMPTYRYGYAVHSHLLPLLDRNSTLSVLAGDIILTPAQTKCLADEAGLVASSDPVWGRQYIYCVYLNNLSAGQSERMHKAFLSWPSYLGSVPASYSSRFRTMAGTMLPTMYVKHGKSVLVDHGMDDPWVGDCNEIGFPFNENNYVVVSVNEQLFSPLLSYKIPSEVFPGYREDVLISLNAISDDPLELEMFDVVLPEAKFGYLRDKKGDLLAIANLDQHSKEELADAIRAQISNGYIYRLQHNVDDTVQFTLALEFPRDDAHPVKLSVGLKYYPQRGALTVVTLT